MAGKKKVTTKTIKKRWVALRAPKSFNEVTLGETYVAEAETVVGKSITVNLMGLLKDPKKQNISITFKVNGMQDGVGTTSAMSYQLSPVSVKRMARRNKSKISDSFKCATKDTPVVVKPVIVTRAPAHNATQTALRKKVREVLTKAFAEAEFEQVMQNLVQYKLQRELQGELKKIFPVQICEIKTLKRLAT